jgi:solute carrier family 25 S-adenosylmethionine transporter 26
MNVVQAISYLYTSSGIAGFYHGFLTYAISDALGGAVKFSVWESWKQHNNKASFGNLAVGAALAFIAASFILVPGELLKQQLQMSYYDSLYEAVQGIYTSFGILGFFSGYDGVVYRDVPYTILELGLYEVFKQQQQIITKRSALDEVVAAAATGGIVAFLTTPLDTVKTKLMVDSLDANFWDCLLLTIQNHGYESLFAGTLARVAWIMPFTAIYLPTYDILKRMLVSSQQRRYYEERQNDDNSIER